MKRILLALALFALALNAKWDENVQQCIVKSDEKACSVVTKRLESECKSGDKVSCFIYADLLGRGLGIAKDASRAAEIFNAQCDLGSSEACYELAVRYLQGSGVEQSFELSGAALDKACKLGSKRACDVLAIVQ